MPRLISLRAKCFVSLLALSAVACGGGGGNGSNAGAPAAITMANAPDIVAAVMTSINGTSRSTAAAPLGSGNGQTGAASAKGGATLAAVSVGPENMSCVFDGSITISATVADPNLIAQGELRPGDDFRSDYSQCDDGDGVINGGFDFTVREFSGDTDQLYLVDMDATFRNLSLLGTGTEYVLDGDSLIRLDSLASPRETLRLESDLLSFEINARGQQFTSTLFRYILEYAVDQSTNACQTRASGAIRSPLFDGEAEFTTTADLTGDCSGNPDSGGMTISGADNATIRITALDNVNVQLEVDPDGDGIVNQTLIRGWAELDPLQP